MEEDNDFFVSRFDSLVGFQFRSVRDLKQYWSSHLASNYFSKELQRFFLVWFGLPAYGCVFLYINKSVSKFCWIFP